MRAQYCKNGRIVLQYSKIMSDCALSDVKQDHMVYVVIYKEQGEERR